MTTHPSLEACNDTPPRGHKRRAHPTGILHLVIIPGFRSQHHPSGKSDPTTTHRKIRPRNVTPENPTLQGHSGKSDLATSFRKIRRIYPESSKKNCFQEVGVRNSMAMNSLLLSNSPRWTRL